MAITLEQYLDAIKSATPENGELDIIKQYIAENPDDLETMYELSDFDMVDDLPRYYHEDSDSHLTSENNANKNWSDDNEEGYESDEGYDSDDDDPRPSRAVTIKVTPLGLALLAKNLHSAKIFINANVDINNVCLYDGNREYTPLSYLTEHLQTQTPFNSEAALLLSTSKTRPSYRTIYNHLMVLQSRKPEKYALRTISTILSAFELDPELVSNYMFSPMFLADKNVKPGYMDKFAGQSYTKLLKVLLDAGLDINHQNASGMSILHVLLYNLNLDTSKQPITITDYVDLVALILKQPNLDLSQLNKEGQSIFDYKNLPQSIAPLMTDLKNRMILAQRVELERKREGTFFSNIPNDVTGIVSAMIRDPRDPKQSSAAAAADPANQAGGDQPTRRPSKPKR